MADTKDFLVYGQSFGTVHTDIKTKEEALEAASRFVSTHKTKATVYEAIAVVKNPLPAVEVVNL